MTRVDVDQGRGATGLTFCRPESQGHEMFGNINTDHLHPGGFNVCAKCDLHISGEIDFTKVCAHRIGMAYHSGHPVPTWLDACKGAWQNKL